MRWGPAWRWIFAFAGLFLVSRVYFVQELLTLLLFFSFAFAALSSLVFVALAFLTMIDRGMDFLEPRLRTLAAWVRIWLSSAFPSPRTVAAETQYEPVPTAPILVKQPQGAI
jgi:hypothetical protein